MMSWGLKRAWARVGWRRRLAALALAAAAAACARAPAPAAGVERAAFPRAPAAAVAHLLADFSTHPHAARPWLLRDERGNYTHWTYHVSFDCGARCSGAASVAASAPGAPAHGPAPRHSVRLHLLACSHLPLLPWPQICDEMELEWEVESAGAGCVVEERARAWCGVLRVLTGACARDLRDLRRQHLDTLRAAL